ncbi:HesA/MoeB/ThiF family protein [Fodinicurvata sediminis]|uniref:HesA/MoeB/ThiF family protein n=1 Tax=Fodinicurvata sediminis TaxID=1121832 RepID=UPI0003B347A0|nr:molybdopterin-synthase adenylyltransferase MoeB [Fodinicurvata sediminis]
MDFTDAQIDRYARHLVLDEIGEEGQARLVQAKVLVIGAGGLGSPLLLYLASAGVGTLGVIDDDRVDLSNLQRQVIHTTADIDKAKTESAAEHLRALNPEVTLNTHDARLSAANAAEIIAQYDLVADGSDSFATRYLVNDACHLVGRPLVSASIMRFDGQLATFRSHLGHGPDGRQNPCYRCLYGEQPEAGRDSCADVGVLAMLPGVMGSLQAAEVVKEILGMGDSMAGRLLLYDALATRFQTITLPADPDCPLCGTAPRIRALDPELYGEAPACRS